MERAGVTIPEVDWVRQERDHQVGGEWSGCWDHGGSSCRHRTQRRTRGTELRPVRLSSAASRSGLPRRRRTCDVAPHELL